jgi:hypothetical protein
MRRGWWRQIEAVLFQTSLAVPDWIGSGLPCRQLVQGLSAWGGGPLQPARRGRLPDGTGAAGYHYVANGAATLSPAPEDCSLSASNDVTQDGGSITARSANIIDFPLTGYIFLI